MLIAELYSGEAWSEGAGHEFEFFEVPVHRHEIRNSFAFFFIFSQAILLFWCGWEARDEFKILMDPKITGDFIPKVPDIGFIALTLFQYLGIDKEVRSMVIWLHPWKSVQPYAAVKCDGHRAFIVGYVSCYQFHVENAKGQFQVLPLQIFLKVIGSFMRILIVTVKREPTTVLATVPVIIGLFWSIYKYKKIRKDRLLLRSWILEMAEQDLQEHQRMACYKLYQLHFPSDKIVKKAFDEVPPGCQSSNTGSVPLNSSLNLYNRAHAVEDTGTELARTRSTV